MHSFRQTFIRGQQASSPDTFFLLHLHILSTLNSILMFLEFYRSQDFLNSNLRQTSEKIAILALLKKNSPKHVYLFNAGVIISELPLWRVHHDVVCSPEFEILRFLVGDPEGRKVSLVSCLVFKHL